MNEPTLPSPSDFTQWWARIPREDLDETAFATLQAWGRSAWAAAVLAERERCAKVAERDEFYGSGLQHDIAAAIREGV